METQNKIAVNPKAKKSAKKYFSVSFLIIFAVLFVLLIVLSGLDKVLTYYYTDTTASNSEKHFKQYLEYRKKQSLEDPKFKEEVKGMVSIDTWDFRTKEEKLIQLKASSGLKNCLPYQNAKYQYALYKKFLKEYETLNKTCSNANPYKNECIKEAENKYEQLKKFHNNLKNNILPNYKKDIDTWHTKQMLSYLASEISDMEDKYTLEAIKHLKENQDNNILMVNEILANKDLMEDFINKMPQRMMTNEEFIKKKARYAALVSKKTVHSSEDHTAVSELFSDVQYLKKSEFDKKFQEEAQKLLIISKLKNVDANEAILPMAEKKIIDDFFKTINNDFTWL